MRSPSVIALGVLLIALPSAAQAISIAQNVADFTSNPGPTINLTPTSSSLWSIQTVSVGGSYRSPFENFIPAGSQGPGYGNAFASIQLGGSALYNFAGPKNLFSILWGSPDAYNTLSFYSGSNGTGSLLLSLTGSNLLIQTFGHDLLQIDFGNQFFESIVLTTASNAFEYTNLQVSDVTAVPIPPALRSSPPASVRWVCSGGAGKGRLSSQADQF
jgi:hypothetical protein